MAEHGDPLSASTWSERWRGTGQVLRLVVGAAPVRATLTAVSVLPNFVSSPLVTLCLGAIVNAVVRQDVRAGVVAAAGIGAIQILANSLGLASFRSRMHLREISGRALSMRMAEAISSIPGIEHLEQPAIADRIELLRNARQQLAGILDAFMISLGRLALVVVTMAALVRISPWFVLLAVAGVPTVVAGARNARRQADLTERQTPDGRRLSHLREVLDTPGPAGEVRVFGLAPELMGRHDRLWRARERDTARLSRRNQLLESGAWLVFAAAYVGALVLILRRAFAGSVTAGDVAVAAGLGATVRGMLESSVGTATWLVDTMRTAAGLVMAARTRRRPPHLPHSRTSTSNVLRKSVAQSMREDAA